MAINIDQTPCVSKSVPVEDKEGIAKAFQEDGYVVVTGILTEAQVQEMLDELWTSPRLLGRFDRNDRSTWGDPAWPQQSNGGRNFLSSSNVFLDAASWQLESNESLLEVQQLVFQRPDIMMQDLGRWGVMRPAANNPEWRTESSWLHWDQNPWTEPGFCRVQAIVCLTDNTATSGGFACVPGFHKQFAQWGQAHPMGSVKVNDKVVDDLYGAGQPFPLPPDDPCHDGLVRVLAPAGSAVIWDSRLPHQNFPNSDATAFRVVHYTMMKVIDDDLQQHRRRLLSQKRILMDLAEEEGPCFPHHLTPTGQQVHCLGDNWPPPLDVALAEFGVEDPQALLEAMRLVREAGALEEQGETGLAIKKHRRSMIQFPDIEEWHEAIF